MPRPHQCSCSFSLSHDVLVTLTSVGACCYFGPHATVRDTTEPKLLHARTWSEARGSDATKTRAAVQCIRSVALQTCDPIRLGLPVLKQPHQSTRGARASSSTNSRITLHPESPCPQSRSEALNRTSQSQRGASRRRAESRPKPEVWQLF